MVVADINEESANETLGSLQRDLRGQGHMTAVVDVTSKESVTKLITSIQVCVCVCFTLVDEQTSLTRLGHSQLKLLWSSAPLHCLQE